jgi:hypothetical protein
MQGEHILYLAVVTIVQPINIQTKPPDDYARELFDLPVSSSSSTVSRLRGIARLILANEPGSSSVIPEVRGQFRTRRKSSRQICRPISIFLRVQRSTREPRSVDVSMVVSQASVMIGAEGLKSLIILGGSSSFRLIGVDGTVVKKYSNTRIGTVGGSMNTVIPKDLHVDQSQNSLELRMHRLNLYIVIVIRNAIGFETTIYI